MAMKSLDTIHHASDFESWSSEQLSDAFWAALIEYQKRPNRRSLEIISCALSWSCHADHGLSSSFCHALEWCGFDIYDEAHRDDLPDQ